MKRTTKTPIRRGLAPSATKLEQKHADGYYTVQEIAKRFELPASTVYTWVQDRKLQAVGGKPAAKKAGANLWILLAAVENKTKEEVAIV
jgi:transposase